MFLSKRVWLGIAVTAVFITLLALRVDFGDMGTALADANYAFVVPAIAVYFITFVFRSYRWSFLLRPFDPDIRAVRLYPVILVGYMANNVLPVRLGELVRSYYLSIRERVRGSTALATIIAERIFDGLTLLLLLVIALSFLPSLDLLDFASDTLNVPRALVVIAIVVPYVAALTTVVLVARADRWVTRVAAVVCGRLPSRAGVLTLSLVERFIAGFQGLHQPTRLLKLLLLSLPIWLSEAAVYYVVALGFDLDSQLGPGTSMVPAILLTLALSNLATSIPSSQGAVGPFELFAVLALEGLGVSAGIASAYAVVLHAAVLVPPIVVGLLHLAMRGVTLAQLTRRPAEPASSMTLEGPREGEGPR